MSDLYIERRGNGRIPLVMIHGWAMHGGILHPLADALAAHCDMYLVDLPGHGHSRDSSIPLEPRACVEAILRETPPVTWLGWSLGGLVAMTAALEHPEAVQRLATISATPKFVQGDDWPQGNPPAMVRRLAADLEADYKATVDRFIALEALGSKDPNAETRQLKAEAYSRGEPDPRVLLEGLRVLEDTDLRARLHELTVPSVWIAGRLDRIVHPAAMRWSAEAAGGRFVELAHAGHAPFIGHAAELAEVLLPFIGADA